MLATRRRKTNDPPRLNARALHPLVVFAKAPRAGEVKTRLARTIGAAAACEAYRELLSVLGASLRPLPRAIVQYWPPDAADELQPFFPPDWEFRPQRGSDLGERMLYALEESAARGASRTVIIGADCPHVTVDDIQQAWTALGRADVVFGPAEDGGYWLVGARRPHPDLFRGIAWGAATVLRQNLENCAAAGLTVELLRRLPDVDSFEDWERFLAWRRTGVTSA